MHWETNCLGIGLRQHVIHLHAEIVVVDRPEPVAVGFDAVKNAREVVTIVHGAAEAAAAEAASRVLFGEPLDAISEATMSTVAGELPTTTTQLPADLADLLTETGLASSKSDAARVVKQGGAYVNNQKWVDGGTVGPEQLLHGRYVLLRRGKDKYHLVVAG